MTEITLAEAVAQSLAVIEAPDPPAPPPPPEVEEEREAPQWSTEQLVCSSCGGEIDYWHGIERSYTEYGTQYGGVSKERWGMDFNVNDSDSNDSSEDEYQCSDCGYSSYQLDEIVVTEKEFHEEHDCDAEGCY